MYKNLKYYSYLAVKKLFKSYFFAILRLLFAAYGVDYHLICTFNLTHNCICYFSIGCKTSDFKQYFNPTNSSLVGLVDNMLLCRQPLGSISGRICYFFILSLYIYPVHRLQLINRNKKSDFELIIKVFTPSFEEIFVGEKLYRLNECNKKRI